MAYEVFVGDKQGVEDRLNNALVLGPFLNSGLPVGGLTLVFNSPAVTVTFSGSLGAMLTMDQIVDEIATQVQAAAPTFVAKKRTLTNQGNTISAQVGGGRPDASVAVVMQLDAGFTIDMAGTANALFKLDTTADTVRSAAVVLAKIAGITQGATPAHYIVVIDLS